MYALCSIRPVNDAFCGKINEIKLCEQGLPYSLRNPYPKPVLLSHSDPALLDSGGLRPTLINPFSQLRLVSRLEIHLERLWLRYKAGRYRVTLDRIKFRSHVRNRGRTNMEGPESIGRKSRKVLDLRCDFQGSFACRLRRQNAAYRRRPLKRR